jgi:hypothetical protein
MRQLIRRHTMSEEQKSTTFVKSFLLLAGGALSAWALTKRQGNPSPAQPSRGDLTPQERADFARRYASTEQALQTMEAYGTDPAISFANFRDAVRQVEQDALADSRLFQEVIRRDTKR